MYLVISVTTIGEWAFQGDTSLTIYAEMASKLTNWSSAWNLVYRPVLWGCTLSADKTYVVSFTKTSSSSISFPTATNGIKAPYRPGYTFGGWATSQVNATNGISVYTAANVNSAPNGTTLYAIWLR